MILGASFGDHLKISFQQVWIKLTKDCRPERAKQTVKYGSEGTKWERAITENKINTESEVDR